MPPKKASRRSTKPRGPPRQAAQARRACDFCAKSCFIESMLAIMVPGMRTYSLCNECGEIFSCQVARDMNRISGSIGNAVLDQEARLRESQREKAEVLERLRVERKRGKELEELLKKEMEGEMERSWWNTPVFEQSQDELAVSMAEMEKLMLDLQKHLAEQAGASSSTAISAITKPHGHDRDYEQCSAGS